MTISLDGTLGITAPAFTSVGAFQQGNTSISGTLAVSSNATLSNTIAVTGNATFSNTIAVTGNASVGGVLTITGNTNLANTAAGNTSITGTLTVSTNATITTNTMTIGTAVYAVANGNVGFGNSAPASKITGPSTYANGTTITGGSSSVTTLDGFFIDCGIYS